MGVVLLTSLLPCLSTTPPYQDTLTLIAQHGYAGQNHTIVSAGYLLQLHRIVPTGESLGVVLLNHGFLADSACWVYGPPESGLAYLLSSAGYDVWLANRRGNMYSRAHETL